MEERRKRLVYVHTHGVDMPERSATPLYLASAAAAMDTDVCIYFTMNGPQLLRKGVPETVSPKNDGSGKPLQFFINQALQMGVKLYVCQPSLDLHNMTQDDLIDGVEMIGGAAFNDLVLDADGTVTF
ncbi:MAG: DsrE family protein [Dehalococcoidia bacterium]